MKKRTFGSRKSNAQQPLLPEFPPRTCRRATRTTSPSRLGPHPDRPAPSGPPPALRLASDDSLPVILTCLRTYARAAMIAGRSSSGRRAVPCAATFSRPPSWPRACRTRTGRSPWTGRRLAARQRRSSRRPPPEMMDSRYPANALDLSCGGLTIWASNSIMIRSYDNKVGALGFVSPRASTSCLHMARDAAPVVPPRARLHRPPLA